MNFEKQKLKEHINYKKTIRENEFSRAQQKSIDFVKLLFGYKIIPENQHITFSWFDFPQYAQKLAAMFVCLELPSYKNKNKIIEVIKDTAFIEAYNLMTNFVNHGFKLPTKKWKGEEYIKYDIFMECCKRSYLDYILNNYTFIKFTKDEIQHLKWYYFLASEKAIKKIKLNHNAITLSISKDFSDNIKNISYERMDSITKIINISELSKKEFHFSIIKLIEKDIYNGELYF